VEEFIEEGRELYEEENNRVRENEEYYDQGYEFVDGEIKRNYLCLQVACDDTSLTCTYCL